MWIQVASVLFIVLAIVSIALKPILVIRSLILVLAGMVLLISWTTDDGGRRGTVLALAAVVLAVIGLLA